MDSQLLPAASAPGELQAEEAYRLCLTRNVSHLLVLDGTWSQARALYRQNPWLTGIPHFQLSPEAPSRYRIYQQLFDELGQQRY